MTEKAPILGIGASPSVVLPVESTQVAVPGTPGLPRAKVLSHRLVRTVSHAALGDVAYHSPACMHKGPEAGEMKDYGEK